METPKLIVKFECPTCGSLYEGEYEAEACCPVEEIFICPVCEEQFRYETDALGHLKKPHSSNENLTIEEEYYEEVLLEGVPTLGLWAFELEKKISEQAEV